MTQNSDPHSDLKMHRAPSVTCTAEERDRGASTAEGPLDKRHLRSTLPNSYCSRSIFLRMRFDRSIWKNSALHGIWFCPGSSHNRANATPLFL